MFMCVYVCVHVCGGANCWKMYVYVGGGGGGATSSLFKLDIYIEPF